MQGHCPSVAIMSKKRSSTCIRALPITAHFGGAAKEAVKLVLWRGMGRPPKALKAWRAAAAKRARYNGTWGK